MNNNIVQFLYKNMFNILSVIVWSVFVIFFIMHHELWWDETEPFILFENFNFIKINEDGHPYLWYILLYPFIKLHFPHGSQILAFIFVFSSIILLYLKSNFNFLLKTFISFSAGMIYFLPVIARSYSMAPLFIFSLAILYPNRKIHPYLYSLFLILLSQVHSYLWGFCMICALLFLWEKYSDFKSHNEDKKLELFTLFAVFIYYLSFMCHTYYDLLNNYNTADISVGMIIEFINNYNHRMAFVFNSFEISGYYLVLILIALIIYFIFLLIKDKKSFFILSFSVLYFLLFCLFVYFGGIMYQKIFLIFLFFIFSYWVIQDKNDLPSKIMFLCINFIFLIVFINPLFTKYAVDDVENSFSNTEYILKYLKNNNIKSDEVYFIVPIVEQYNLYKRLYQIPSENIPHSLYDRKFNKINEIKLNEINVTLQNNTKIKYIVINSMFINLIQKFPTPTHNTHSEKIFEEIQEIPSVQCRLVSNFELGEMNKIFKIKEKKNGNNKKSKNNRK